MFLYAGFLRSDSFPQDNIYFEKSKIEFSFFCFSLRAARTVTSSGNYTINASKTIYLVRTDNSEMVITQHRACLCWRHHHYKKITDVRIL